jgi:hypothetical protein
METLKACPHCPGVAMAWSRKQRVLYPRVMLVLPDELAGMFTLLTRSSNVTRSFRLEVGCCLRSDIPTAVNLYLCSTT